MESLFPIGTGCDGSGHLFAPDTVPRSPLPPSEPEPARTYRCACCGRETATQGQCATCETIGATAPTML